MESTLTDVESFVMTILAFFTKKELQRVQKDINLLRGESETDLKFCLISKKEIDDTQALIKLLNNIRAVKDIKKVQLPSKKEIEDLYSSYVKTQQAIIELGQKAVSELRKR